MKFYSNQVKKGHHEAILLGHENEVLFHIRVSQDTMVYWQTGFLRMMGHNDNHLSQFQRLVGETAYFTGASYMGMLRH